jgi:beta-mannosidase
VAYKHKFKVNAAATAETGLGQVDWPTNLPMVHFVKLELHNRHGKLLSDNFYWRTLKQDDFQDLNLMPTVTLDTKVSRHDANGNCLLEVTLHNSSSHIALMAHLQLRQKNSGERVLPVYYSDNYVSLVPGESKTISIEAALSALKGQMPLIVVDGWNISVKPQSFSNAAIALNEDAQVNHWPVTGLPVSLQ